MWLLVQVRKLPRIVTLQELKDLRSSNETAASLQLFTTARLSIQNVTEEQWQFILRLADDELGGSA